MRNRDRIKARLRREGFWGAGQLTGTSDVGGDVNTAGRPFARTGFPLLPSNSQTVGNDNMFLVGKEYDMPVHAGLWPYVL